MKDLIVMIEILRLFDKLGLSLEQQSIIHNVIMEFRDKNMKIKKCPEKR